MQENRYHTEPLPPPEESANAHYMETVIRALGDSPETVIATQFLRDAQCEVLCVGDPADLEGIIIQAYGMPTEPVAFGTSAEAIGSLIPHLQGWSCINVPAALADELTGYVSAAAGTPHVRILDDIYHILTVPVPESPVANARLLAIDDRDLILNASPELLGGESNRLYEIVQSGHAAGVIHDHQLVSVAHTFAASARYVDIGVVTHPAWRRKGFASAAAGLIAEVVQKDGRCPVWSCGSTNFASLRVAARLGFVEVSRRSYLIPEFDEQ